MVRMVWSHLPRSVLHHNPDRKWRDFWSTKHPDVAFRFPAALNNFCTQQSYHLMCKQWLNEAFFPSNSIPAARGPHYKICHARGTNRAVTISPIAGRWGGGWEDSPAFAPLREPCLSIGLLVEQQSRGSGAYLRAPSLRVGAICSVLSTEI